MSTNETYRQIAINRGGLDSADVFVVRNGPDIDRFKPVVPNKGLKKGKQFLVGYVGTMGAQEGLDTLLSVALCIATRGRRDVHFICVGGGPALDDLRAMCTDMNLDDTVVIEL